MKISRILAGLFDLYKGWFTKYSYHIIISFSIYFFIIGYYYSYLPVRKDAANLRSQIEQIRAEHYGIEQEIQKKLLLPLKEISSESEILRSLPREQRVLAKELTEFGRYSISKGNYEIAMEKLDQSLGVAVSPEALYYKGIAFFNQQDFSMAVQTWRKILKISASKEFKRDVILYIGVACYQMNDLDRANHYFRVFIEKTRVNPSS